MLGVVLLGALSASAQNARIVLRWKDVPGASAYELQIAKDAAFVEVVLQTRTTTAGYRWEQLPTTTHWWRVRSFDAESRASEWSPPRTIAVDTAIPTPLKPVDGAQVSCGATASFEFDPSPLIKEYQLELSASAEFNSVRTLRSTGTTFEVPGLPAGTWWWRTRGVDLKGRTSGPGPVRSLQVRISPPKLKAVGDVPLGTPQVLLSWAEAGCAKSYLVEATQDGRDKISLPAPSNSLAFKAGVAGDYRWRVASVDERGTAGEFSPDSSFKVRLPTPGRLNEAVALRAELTWSPVPSAASYKVEVQRAGAKELVATVPGTSWRSSELPPGEYRWRVTARDALGHASLPSEYRSFIRPAGAPMDLPQWLQPVSDLVVAPGATVDLAWKPVAGATRYELEFDGTPVPLPVARATTPALTEGPHVVRVRALGDGFRSSDWTAPLELYAGRPPVAKAEVTLVGLQVRVKLTDSKGRKIDGLAPRLAVRAGSLAPVEPLDDGFQAAWSPPAAGEDVLVIDEREFHFEQPLVTPMDPPFSLAVRAGGIFSGGAVASPTVGLGFTVRLPFLQRRPGIELRVGGYRATSSFQLGGQTLEAQAWLLPISVVVAWHQTVSAFQLKLGLGPAAQLAWLQVGADSAFHVLPGFEIVAAVSRRLGPGRLEAEVGFAYSRLDVPLARLNAGGVAVRLGYAFDF